jgi:acetylglutamate kinase
VTGPRVYKVGGPALEDPSLLTPLARELAGDARPALVVHGGGRAVDRMLGLLGLETRFVGGRRETSPEQMEIVEMVLSGLVNKALASGLSRRGVPAVGVSGRDGRLVQASLAPGLGRVGVPDAVDPGLVKTLWGSGLVPVVSPVSDDPEGNAVNVNADEAALGLARALGAATLVYLSDVDGVRGAGGLVPTLDPSRARAWIEDGTISGGMELKVRTALDASRAGIPEVVIAGRARLDGGFPGTRLVHEEGRA